MADLADTRVTINATPNEALDFLTKLAGDDEFRARFQESPGEVLAEHHLYFPVEHLPAHAVLPAKETLQGALADFMERGELHSGGLMSPDRWAFGLFWWLYYSRSRPQVRCAATAGTKTGRQLGHDDDAALLERMGKLRISASVTPREMFNFLLRLASDDHFRARLSKEPNEVLAEHHIYVPLPEPIHVILPSKRDIQQVLIDMMTGYARQLSFVPFNANAELSWFVSFFTFLAARGAAAAK